MRRRVVCPRSHPASPYVRGTAPLPARGLRRPRHSSQYLPGGRPGVAPCSGSSTPSPMARSICPGGDPASPHVRGLRRPHLWLAVFARGETRRRPMFGVFDALTYGSQYLPGGRPPGTPHGGPLRCGWGLRRPPVGRSIAGVPTPLRRPLAALGALVRSRLGRSIARVPASASSFAAVEG